MHFATVRGCWSSPLLDPVFLYFSFLLWVTPLLTPSPSGVVVSEFITQTYSDKSACYTPLLDLAFIMFPVCSCYNLKAAKKTVYVIRGSSACMWKWLFEGIKLQVIIFQLSFFSLKGTKFSQFKEHTDNRS